MLNIGITSFGLPFGRITSSCLNSGLTIIPAELEGAVPINITYNGEEETPYKIGFCYKGKFGLNEHKLQQGFKTIFDSTVLKHIRKLRLRKARELIPEKNLSVSDAGYYIGYTNLSHFATAFRQEFGILPRKLQK